LRDPKREDIEHNRLFHNVSFSQVCKDGDMDIVKAMMERTHVDLQTKDVNGRTPLHRASVEGRLAVVQYLCEHGADKEASDGNDKTPVHWAAQVGPISAHHCSRLKVTITFPWCSTCASKYTCDALARCVYEATTVARRAGTAPPPHPNQGQPGADEHALAAT